MKTIVVAVDFSPVTRAVLRHARSLARLIGGRLILVHVVKLPVLGDYPGMMAESSQIVDFAEYDSRSRLRRLCRRLRAAKIPSKAVVFVGSPASEILKEVRKSRADYIVIGSHGHNAFYNFVVGSTTAIVLKKAPCPVLVVASPPPQDV